MPMLRNIFIVFAFVLWILPLGVFIKPIDEKKVCDGKRAICMCSFKGQAKTGVVKQFLLKHIPSSEKNTPSGNGNYLVFDFNQINSMASSGFSNNTSNLYFLIAYKPIEHVPKAQLL